MKTNEKKRVLALAKRDQTMEHFKSHKDQLINIIEDGPKSNDDMSIIKKCMHFVMAEICMAESESIDL